MTPTASVFNPIMLFISVVGVTAGFVLLLIAWHGRRVDDHPICRKCGFDLVGQDGTGKRCPECGADVQSPRNVQKGRRKTRPGILALSLIVMLGSTAMLVVTATPIARSIQWIRLVPTAWLLEDLDSPVASDETAAARELARRLRAGSLEDETFESLIDVSLARQADRSRTWIASYGDVLEIALLTERLTEDERVQILRNAIQPTMLVVPEKDDDGDIQSLSLGYRSGVLHVGSDGMLALGATLKRWRIDDGEWVAADDNRATISIFGGSSSQVLAAQVDASLTSGPHLVETEWQFDFVPTLKQVRSRGALVTTTKTLSLEIEIE